MPAKRRARRRKKNVAAGFMDEDGIFHPIRSSYDYDRGRGGDRHPGFKAGHKKGKRKKNPGASVTGWVRAKAVKIVRNAKGQAVSVKIKT